MKPRAWRCLSRELASGRLVLLAHRCWPARGHVAAPPPAALSRTRTPSRPSSTAATRPSKKKPPPLEKTQRDSTVMTTTAQLAVVPSADTPGACVYLHHDQCSYIFGRVPEGTQRAFNSRKIHFGGTEHIFLSGPVGWDQMGGLLGYLLTVGSGVEAASENVAQENAKRLLKNAKLLKRTEHRGIAVHGGDNLCHVLAACRPIILRQAVRVRLCEHRADPRGAAAAAAAADRDMDMGPDWRDENINVWKVPVRRARSSSPPKRAHGSIDGAGGVDKPPSTLSDPAVASAIVEGLMFSGKTAPAVSLETRKLGQLKPGERAIVNDNGVMRPYRRPGDAASADGKLPDADVDADANLDANPAPNPDLDPDTTGWVLTEASEPSDDGGGYNSDCATLNRYRLPPTCYSQTAMSYVVKCHSRRGKFNAPAAQELGVNKVDFKFLAMGQSVRGKDGMTVTPDMVLGEPQPGKGIIVADIPSLDFMDGFMQRPEWKSAELMANIAIVYWILGPGLAGDGRVLAFTQRHASMRHVFCAEDTCPNMMTHPGVGELQVQLRRIDPERFPLISFDNAVRHPSPAAGSAVELGRAGTKVQLMPRLVLDVKAADPFPDLARAAAAVDWRALRMAKAARAEATDAAFLARVEAAERDMPNRDAEIVPLGTGSSAPSKHRNVSATLVRVPGVGAYLLDCGEGTLGQLRRAFGDDGAAEVLRELRCVVVSHLHADHHLGVVSVARAWYARALADGRAAATLAVSCIARFRDMLAELAQAEDFGMHRLRFPNCAPCRGGRDREHATAADYRDDYHRAGGPAPGAGADADAGAGADPAADSDPAADPDPASFFGLASITRIPVHHCWRSHAVQLELASGLRIAYSGDCRPSRAFARACRGAHLLVHECTFGDDMQAHALVKNHCSMSEALAVARDMRARRVLLTHFSQRYVKADSLRQQPEGEGQQQHVLLALDMMRARLGEFQQAACYVPAVQALMEKQPE